MYILRVLVEKRSIRSDLNENGDLADNHDRYRFIIIGDGGGVD